MITGAESLNFQGWPIFEERFQDLLESESNHVHQDLAGNTFPTTCVAACILAIVFAADLTSEEDGDHACSTAADIDKAMLLLRQAEC